jgi:hypothetical protein
MVAYCSVLGVSLARRDLAPLAVLPRDRVDVGRDSPSLLMATVSALLDIVIL